MPGQTEEAIHLAVIAFYEEFKGAFRWPISSDLISSELTAL